jgi:predicted nuclease with TOPRIM domain
MNKNISSQENIHKKYILQENYDNLQDEFDILKDNHNNLQESFDNLQENFDNLKQSYDNLQEKYDKLLNDYSENVIIQSMNDMKQKYDTLIKTSVSLYKHQILQDKFTNLIRSFSGCSVLIDHTVKVLKQTKNVHLLDKKNLISKAELELITIKEILEDSIIFNSE